MSAICRAAAPNDLVNAVGETYELRRVGSQSNRCSAGLLSSTVNAYEVSLWTVNRVLPYEALTRRSIVGAGRAVYRPLFTTSAISCAALTPGLSRFGDGNGVVLRPGRCYAIKPPYHNRCLPMSAMPGRCGKEMRKPWRYPQGTASRWLRHHHQTACGDVRFAPSAIRAAEPRRFCIYP